MKIDIEKTIPISKVNQNFSEAARLTNEKGTIIIMKSNKPKFVLMTYEQYVAITKKQVGDLAMEESK